MSNIKRIVFGIFSRERYPRVLRFSGLYPLHQGLYRGTLLASLTLAWDLMK